MQLGHFYRAHGAWHLRYRVNGKQVSVKLADYSDEYRTLTSVRPLAEPYLQTANSGQQANGHLNLQQYAETVYFLHAKKSLKSSTYKGYFNLYIKHIEPRIGGLRLLSYATHNLQRVLWTIDGITKRILGRHGPLRGRVISPLTWRHSVQSASRKP
jgi:hypothetical protein